MEKWCWSCLADLSLTDYTSIALRCWQSPCWLPLLSQAQAFPHTSFCHVPLPAWSICYCLYLCGWACFGLETHTVFFAPHCHLCSLCARSLSKETFTVCLGTSRALDFSERVGWLFSVCNTAVLPSPRCRAGPSRQTSSQDGACPKPLLIGV